jgi:hypothetical protein
MITNFEKETNFNPEKHLPVVVWLETYFRGTKGNRIPTSGTPIVGKKICDAIKARLDLTSFGESELRLCIHQTRKRGIVPIGSSSKGYFLIQSQDEMDLQIRSLEERASAIQSAADSLRQFTMETQKTLFDELFNSID